MYVCAVVRAGVGVRQMEKRLSRRLAAAEADRAEAKELAEREARMNGNRARTAAMEEARKFDALARSLKADLVTQLKQVIGR